MKRILFILLLSVSVFFAQEIEIEQLTNTNLVICNPVFPYYIDNMPGFWWNQTYSNTTVFFEVHDDISKSGNVAYLEFNHDERKFDNEIVYLTNNQFIQKNITVTTFPKFIVMWETNKNGNWDIEYVIYQSDSTWSDSKILIGSDQDEINPKIVKTMSNYYPGNYENTLWFTFEKNHKVYFAEFEDSLKSIELVFPDTVNYQYSKPTASIMAHYGSNDFFLAAEMRETQNSKKQIILTDKEIGTNDWQEFKVLCDSGNSHNPEFLQIGYDTYYFLSFEIEDNFRNSVNILFDESTFDPRNYDPYNSGYTELKSDPTISTYDFFSYAYFIITKQILITDFELYFPFIYRKVKNDSTFIVFNTSSYPNEDNFVTVDHKNASIAVGPVGLYPTGVLSYMVWTDSTENGINLFGVHRYDGLGSVGNNEKLENAISLHQNYPNPFNPTTKIKFTIPNVGDENFRPLQTQLIVYDILGREIKTLLNKPMQPGEYEVEFDATGLPSGVYFYRLTSGSFSQTRKMVLLR
ncbi:hypothetical protein ASZ90_005047 [hydrocarbon metagenome]|uniref:Secretion system C-terminal sorting domain-containing protein n=1 Tax=hydrocarbon metagenome TaxID=938273 RepID=A0A0W8FW81_9ZZZZ